ncbi:Ribosomal RNA small subunit methyltransferase [Trichinella spiralis]|uniref:Ribosomal RNA small subunit methyltransferase n=1 Tax=Trichinella spiralis TaxID=6334 RepID=A0ABR3K1Z1_TRISP
MTSRGRFSRESGSVSHGADLFDSTEEISTTEEMEGSAVEEEDGFLSEAALTFGKNTCSRMKLLSDGSEDSSSFEKQTLEAKSSSTGSSLFKPDERWIRELLELRGKIADGRSTVCQVGQSYNDHERKRKIRNLSQQLKTNAALHFRRNGTVCCSRIFGSTRANCKLQSISLYHQRPAVLHPPVHRLQKPTSR